MVTQKKLPDFYYEDSLWKLGYRAVAGIDEVGRGCFAGPVCAAAVAFGQDLRFRIYDLGIKINDSKKLSAKQREKSAVWIKQNCLAWGIGEASVIQINKFGIKKATEIAFRKAILNCEVKIDYLLIDAFYIPYVKGLKRKNQNAIIKGDSKSFSIAAASIIAKVYRDNLMSKLGQKFEVYDWHINKGYGTRKHREAIQKHGVTRYHRTLFVRKLI